MAMLMLPVVESKFIFSKDKTRIIIFINIYFYFSFSATDKIVGNPIGWLQEMCMSRRWPPPTYETETEVGLPHERLFTIACNILNFREVGKGKSKKIAKRTAAHKMWTRLQETPIDDSQLAETMGTDLGADVSIIMYASISIKFKLTYTFKMSSLLVDIC